MIKFCPLCNRILGDVNIDKHHLIPKCKGGKVIESIHKICHRKIHASFSEKQLEKAYHTWSSLQENDIIKTFIKWVQTKPSEFYSGSNEIKTRR